MQIFFAAYILFPGYLIKVNLSLKAILCTVLMGDDYSRAEPVLCRSRLMKQTAASSQESRQEASYNYEPHGILLPCILPYACIFFLFPAAW